MLEKEICWCYCNIIYNIHLIDLTLVPFVLFWWSETTYVLFYVQWPCPTHHVPLPHLGLLLHPCHFVSHVFFCFFYIRPQCCLGLMLFCKIISNLGRLIVVCCVGFHRIDLDDLFLQFIYQHCINQMIATTTTVSLLMKTHLKRTITPPPLVRQTYLS